MLFEYDIWMDDCEWKVINDVVEMWLEDGCYIVFFGYEWMFVCDMGGYYNVFFWCVGM